MRWLIHWGIVVVMAGCGGYPKVSPRAYEISTALYTICNQRDPSRLTVVETLITESLDAGEITSGEAEMLRGLVARANAEKWEQCGSEVRQLMLDQTDL